MNAVLHSLMSHRSVRAYTDEPVSTAEIEDVLKAAQAAPNWVNLQHVSVIAIKDAQRRSRLADLCGNQGHIAQAPVFLVFCADFYRTQLACEKHGHGFDNSQAAIDNLIVGAHDVGIAVGTAVAAAESLGLGTVVIGDVRLHAHEVIDMLKLPRLVMPMLGLCIGHPAESPGLKPRLPLEAVCFDEEYDSNLADYLEEYDRAYARYLEARPQNNRTGTWTKLAADFYHAGYNHYSEVPSALAKQGLLPHSNPSPEEEGAR